MLFSQYKESGFDIKWVDDTHALAVFSSSKIGKLHRKTQLPARKVSTVTSLFLAAEVLANGHALVQLKPLAEATVESRTKARKCSSSLQPYRARPETCAALARRLVTTALGVRLKTAPEERENEKRVLREAKGNLSRPLWSLILRLGILNCLSIISRTQTTCSQTTGRNLGKLKHRYTSTIHHQEKEVCILSFVFAAIFIVSLPTAIDLQNLGSQNNPIIGVVLCAEKAFTRGRDFRLCYNSGSHYLGSCSMSY